MRRSEIQRLVDATVLGDMPGFTLAGDLLYEVKGPILGGFLFESSDFDPALLYVWAFVMPLYVPASRISLTFGRRIEARTSFLSWKRTWRVDGNGFDDLPALLQGLRRGRDLIRKLDSPAKLVRSLRWSTNPLGSIWIDRAVAYSHVWLGHRMVAMWQLKALLRQARREKRENLIEESTQLLAGIEGGTRSAQDQLEAWVGVTARALGVPPQRVQEDRFR